MPRNRNKTPCQVPNCRNYAMRGHTHCRSHRDHELGNRGGGAPPGNLNAINTGRHAHPVSPTDLQQGAHQLTIQPELLTKWLGQAVDSVQSRTGGDPYRSLVALRSVLSHLASHVAADLFKTEMAALLVQLSPSLRDRFLRAIHVCYGHRPPGEALRGLRKLVDQARKPEKQVPVHKP